jgi:methionyl-tRNA formyltransferase
MYILASKKNYFSINLFNKLNEIYDNFIFISEKKELKDKINDINPIRVFFLHWSFIVPKSIYNKFECINLHVGNLPKGKGGSPIQNQILEGITQSRVNALRMSDDGLDAGPIYCFEYVSLQGNLFDIWDTLSKVGFKLINNIIENNVKPKKQEDNNFKVYKRRKNNNIPFDKEDELSKIYDFIRMLDSPYYPNPYLQIGNFKLEFNRANFNGEDILCDVKIKKDKIEKDL